ncbi:MAG: hypothetical protein LKG27_03845 [Clostridiaceae bacterium]|jgi:hypothetical protein|nr:hypothetical protein [Clostridiaceae bacterium]
MYIFELLCRFINKKYERNVTYNPLDNKDSTDTDNETTDCEHIFLPIDSTGEILSCSKCGLVVHKKDLKKKNIFKI